MSSGSSLAAPATPWDAPPRLGRQDVPWDDYVSPAAPIEPVAPPATPAEKEALARAWLRVGDLFQAALEVFNQDTGRALRANWELPRDNEFMELRKQILEEEGLTNFLPSRDEASQRAWIEATNMHLKARDRILALELYMRSRNFIEQAPKPTVPPDPNAKDPIFLFVPEDELVTAAVE